jgi:hypothetical protein
VSLGWFLKQKGRRRETVEVVSKFWWVGGKKKSNELGTASQNIF